MVVERVPRRLLAVDLFVVVVSIAVIVMARVLGPDVRGYGTHTQLGLPPCGLQSITGVRCPTCGLTTSFSWIVRGEFASAQASNPMGLALFAAMVVAALYSGIKYAYGYRWYVPRPIVLGLCLILVVSLLVVGLVRWLE